MTPDMDDKKQQFATAANDTIVKLINYKLIGGGNHREWLPGFSDMYLRD